MSSFLRRWRDRLLGGRGKYSITVPVLDGALKPNDYLERAAAVATLERADDLVAVGHQIFLSSGRSLYRLMSEGEPELVGRQDRPITCLAASPAGALAIGQDDAGIVIKGGRFDGKNIMVDQGETRTNCPSAAIFESETSLLLCNGSAQHCVAEWRRDFLSLGRSGSVLRVDLESGRISVLAGRLAFPAGICLSAGAGVIISEAWRHRLIAIGSSGSPVAQLSDLPAYPGRLIRAAEGGYWLAMISVRTQLQEFVLREHRYRNAMMETVDPEFWICPSLSSGRSFKEPLQAGGVIRLGIRKPWAPTRSYGLIVRLDDALQPVWSAHSRANGRRHGITSLVENSGRLLATSSGAGEVLALPHTALDEPDQLSAYLEAAA